ncbi:MAG: hypothetical protein ACT4OP_12785 [Actinomycetota bacterium]
MKLRLLIALVVLTAACGSGTTVTTRGTTTTQEATTTSEGPTKTIATTTTGGELTTTTAATDLIRVEGGIKVEGPATISVVQGKVVSFQVVADVADEVHVHGYDLFFATLPGERVLIEFTADASGIFDVELEGSHLDLVHIEVTP